MLNAALLTAIFCALTPACSKKPVLYPNEHLKRVDREQADADIKRCMELAEEYDVKTRQGDKVAKSTAIGAAGGAVGGAVGGAISGNLGALLQNIIQVGDDLHFRSAVCGPSLLLEGLTISGL